MLTTRERYLIWMAYASFARETNYDERALIEKAEMWLKEPISYPGWEGPSCVEEYISKAADDYAERHGE